MRECIRDLTRGGRTAPFEDILCPKCGHLGQVKRVQVDRNPRYRYWRVDHYGKIREKGRYTKRHITYRSSCYFGKEEPKSLRA